ncbi:MAG: PmoA family protein [Verrucomicrobiales bacterium]|nr:PmoA family protein [Verrucomicrobiales bacterium]
MIRQLALTVLFSTLLPQLTEAQFSWKDTEGKYLDLTHGSRSIARYVYEPVDDSSIERRNETYKPFCHIYQWWSGDNFITKGPGGKYPHHRGIYYGFSRISYTDDAGVKHEKVDNWHCRKAAQVHREFTDKVATKDSASFTSRIDWLGDNGTAFASESRSMTFSLQNKDIVIDFTSTLTPLISSLLLDGDPQHAGFQFRASQEVFEKTAKATYFIRPDSGIGKPGVTINWSSKTDNEQTRDLPWKGMAFRLKEKTYTVAYLDALSNPKPARYSERDYGRFGSYFATEVAKEAPLTVNYRLIIRMGEMTPEEISAMSEAFANN